MRVYAGASRRVKTRWGNHSTRWAFYPPHIMCVGKRQGKREEEREKGGGRVEAHAQAAGHGDHAPRLAVVKGAEAAAGGAEAEGKPHGVQQVVLHAHRHGVTPERPPSQKTSFST